MIVYFVFKLGNYNLQLPRLDSSHTAFQTTDYLRELLQYRLSRL